MRVYESPDEKALVAVTNEAYRQLRDGKLDASRLKALLTTCQEPAQPLVPLVDRLHDGFPQEPTGLSLAPLHALDAASGGLQGLVVVGGEPGAGKSTLVFQLILIAARTRKVIYYDYENGENLMLYRLSRIAQGDLVVARELIRNVYTRRHIGTLDDDLEAVGEPCVIVVDSLQSLPRGDREAIAGIDAWLFRFEELQRIGHTVVVVSEVNRASYGHVAGMGGYKHSGEIEYKATLGIRLVTDYETPDVLELHVVKNRYRARKGLVCVLQRDPQRVFWFREVW